MFPAVVVLTLLAQSEWQDDWKRAQKEAERQKNKQGSDKGAAKEGESPKAEAKKGPNNDAKTGDAKQKKGSGQGQAGQALTVGQSLLTQLKMTKSVGRLVINLESVMSSPIGSANDVVLREGDLLIIPKQKQEVTVIGEVQNNTSHFYRAGLTRDDYIGLSGGVTRKADRGRIYIVRADGSVISSESSGWFRRSAQVNIKPGDTVVVPLDTERMPALPLWAAVDWPACWPGAATGYQQQR